MEILEKIHDICLGRECDDCPFSNTPNLECPFEEYPAGWNLEKIKEVINGTCDDCPFQMEGYECPFEEYPVGCNLEKIKEVINGGKDGRIDSKRDI